MATNWNIELTLTYGEETENAFPTVSSPAARKCESLNQLEIYSSDDYCSELLYIWWWILTQPGQCLGAHKLHGVKQHSLLTSWYLKGSVGAAKNQRAGEPVLCAGMYCSEMRIHSLYANSIGIHYSGEGRGMRRLLSRGAFNVFPHFFFVAFLFLLYVCRHRPKRDKYFVCLESHFVSIWESFQLGQRERRTEACTRLN